MFKNECFAVIEDLGTYNNKLTREFPYRNYGPTKIFAFHWHLTTGSQVYSTLVFTEPCDIGTELCN